MSVTARIVSWARDLRWSDVPDPVRRWLAIRVADSLGVIGGARDSRPGAAVLDLARATEGPAPLLFERTTVMTSYAALAHGALAHTYDYDDTYPESVVHPSSIVVPAALAAGHAASGDRVLVGALAGYEFLARSGAVAGRGFHARGFHATGVLGPIAAALVAGLVTDADELAVVHAMGLAGSMSGGLLEFLADGSWSKRLHPGWAAHGGLVASQLAVGGFSGPATVLEGHNGLFRAFLDAAPDQVTGSVTDLGDRWACLSLQTKLYPCAHVIHPYLDLLLPLVEQRRFHPAQVRAITCHVAPWAVPLVCEPLARKRAPSSEYEARASLPYALAVALIDGAFHPAALADDELDRAEVLQAAAKVHYAAAEDLDHDFPARIEIRLDGAEVIGLDSTSLPAPEEHDERLRAKFDSNLVRVTDSAGRQRIWDTAMGLGESDPAHLASVCAKVASSC